MENDNNNNNYNGSGGTNGVVVEENVTIDDEIGIMKNSSANRMVGPPERRYGGGPLGPCLVTFMKCMFDEDDGMECRGIWIDQLARGIVYMSFMFLGPAILEAAKKSAGCKIVSSDDNVRNDDDGDCRVSGGIKPSSILSTMALVGGLCATFGMPIFGAIMDHTPHRWKFGAWTAALLVIGKGLETMVSTSTWEFVVFLQVLTSVVFTCHVCTALPYVSELTDVPSDQTRYNVAIAIAFFAGSLFLSVVVLLISIPLDTDDVGTARISQIITTLLSASLFAYAWIFLLPHRPAFCQVPPGTTLLQTGFQKIFHTCQRLHSDLTTLKWFFLSCSFSFAASNGIASIGTTFMNDYLQMTGNEIGIVFFIILITGVPGTKLAEFITHKLNPFQSIVLCYILFILCNFLGAFLLMRGPEDKHYMYLIAVLWGITFGWMSPMNDAIIMTIIPPNQASEMMGMYLFCQQAIGWLPPLVFTLLNEAGAHMTVGLCSTNLFFILGICCLLKMGPYDDVIAKSSPTTNKIDEKKSSPTTDMQQNTNHVDISPTIVELPSLS